MVAHIQQLGGNVELSRLSLRRYLRRYTTGISDEVLAICPLASGLTAIIKTTAISQNPGKTRKIFILVLDKRTNVCIITTEGGKLLFRYGNEALSAIERQPSLVDGTPSRLSIL